MSLDLVEGEVMALVGESGSGKSVLTKTFTGMLEDNGRIANGSINYRWARIKQNSSQTKIGKISAVQKLQPSSKIQ